jgi:translation initiation factor IF-2
MSVQPRPPIVAFMGHVDHGKTSLLDYIRKTSVAAKEHGGITQHIGAYQAEYQKRQITFIDTPGHEAFSKMRSRGAAVTDLVVLVISATEGVKPQTVESIKHIQAANVPFLIAMNKMDLPDANPDLIKSQLTEHTIIVEDYGGDVVMVPVSAKTGDGVDKLLEMILLMADMKEIKADPDADLEAVVIESVKDVQRGSAATLLIKQGTLHAGDLVYLHNEQIKIRAMFNFLRKPMKVAPPGTPVEVIGWKSVPQVGELITGIMLDESVTAKKKPDAVNGEAPKHALNIILKSDTAGTLEAILQSVTEEIEVISSGVGEVTEQDVLTAEATNAKILSFQVKVSSDVQKLADSHNVKIKQYAIIYDLFEYLQQQVLAFLDPMIDEVELGVAQVAATFSIRGDAIAGCKVLSGEIAKNMLCHLRRNGVIVADPKITSLKRGKEDIESAKMGTECGIVFTRFKDFAVGDEVVCYKKKE